MNPNNNNNKKPRWLVLLFGILVVAPVCYTTVWRHITTISQLEGRTISTRKSDATQRDDNHINDSNDPLQKITREKNNTSQQINEKSPVARQHEDNVTAPRWKPSSPIGMQQAHYHHHLQSNSNTTTSTTTADSTTMETQNQTSDTIKASSSSPPPPGENQVPPLYTNQTNQSTHTTLSANQTNNNLGREESTSKNVTEPKHPGFSESNKPLCSATQVVEGQWISKLLTSQPYKTKYKSPDCASYESPHSWINGTIHSHEWVPHDSTTDCEFAPFNVKHFCQVMDNETLLLMGDSLTLEHHGSLGNLLDQVDRETQYADWKVKACGQRARVVLRRVDYLDPERYVSWELRNKFPKYAVFNTGAHYTPNKRFMKTINETIVLAQEWQARCKAVGKQCQLIWRTSVPGHPNCKSIIQKPVNNLTLMEKRVAESDTARNYNWDKFQRQNLLAIKAFRASGLNFAVLDAYKINMLRPDGHIIKHKNDCLHSCLGSKVDVYNQVMLHLMRLHQQEDTATMG